MNIFIEVPEFFYTFQVDGGKIEIKSLDINPDFVWTTYRENNNLPLTETPRYDCTQIGTKPVQFQL